MGSLQVVFGTWAVITAVVVVAAVVGNGWSAKAARRILISLAIIPFAAAVWAWAIQIEEGSPAYALSEFLPAPLAAMVIFYAAGVDSRRGARLALFAALASVTRFQFGMLTTSIFIAALAFDLEWHRDAWKKGLAFSLAGIVIFWVAALLLSRASQPLDALTFFAVGIFCFVHAECYLDTESAQSSPALAKQE